MAYQDFPNLISPYVTLSAEQIEKARFVTSADFLKLDDKFLADPHYLKIGYPLRAGTLVNPEAFLQSDPYKFLDARREKFGLRRRDTFKLRPYDSEPLPAFTFLKDASNQFRTIDFRLYNQPAVKWKINYDMRVLGQHCVHRREEGDLDDEQQGQGIYHIDIGFGNRFNIREIFAKARAELKNPGDPIGVPRYYAMATIFPTKFKNHPGFKPWDVMHFIGEEHFSPPVPEDCLRGFILAEATPVMPYPPNFSPNTPGLSSPAPSA